MHKRFDPIYVDARDRIRKMGGFGYMYGQLACAGVRARVRDLSEKTPCGAPQRYAYMSQPKHQLETFRAWAGAHGLTPTISPNP